MKSDYLLSIINSVSKPSQLLTKLQEFNFAVKDITEDGDPVLHVLIKSKHIAAYNFIDYMKLLVTAGADINAEDKQDKDFLTYYLASAPQYMVEQVLNFLLGNSQFNINRSAIPTILSKTEYQRTGLIRTLVNHKQFQIDYLDKTGNNYLQQVIIFYRDEADKMVDFLIKKGINLAYKNPDGKSVFDFIVENKAQRPTYANRELLLKLFAHCPSALLDIHEKSRSLLSILLKDGRYNTAKELSILIENYITAGGDTGALTKAILHCFNDFRKNLIPEETMLVLIQVIIQLNIDIDVENCFALTSIRNPENNTIYQELKSLRKKVNFNQIISYVEELTEKDSEEQSVALKNVFASCLPLDCFDDAILPVEEQYLRNRNRAEFGLDSLSLYALDSKMFGHLFSLSGSVPIDSMLTLTSSCPTQTTPFMTHLMNSYFDHCKQSGKYVEHLDAIEQVRNMTVKAMRYHFLFNFPHDILHLNSPPEEYLAAVKADSESTGIEIPTGWSGHMVSIILQGQNLYRNNGGGCSTDTTTEHYKISKPENLTDALFKKLYTEASQESNKRYIQQELHDALGLEYLGPIEGKFQEVGNCSFESLRIALKVKYRLFLPELIADEIYADTIAFFDQFYLEEYLSRYREYPNLPHILMRLIIQKLIPENRFELANRLAKEHLASDDAQEIMQAEFMLNQWRGKKPINFSSNPLNIPVNTKNNRLQLLHQFLENKISPSNLSEYKSWSHDRQLFQGYHLLHFAVMNNNLELVLATLKKFPETVNQANWYNEEPLCFAQTVEMINLLVQAGANLANTDDNCALNHAIKANKPELVLALLKHGAKTSEYSTYYAANKNPRILQYLIDYCPEALKKPYYNYSLATHAAAIDGNRENLRALVYSGGLNPETPDVNGVTPLQLALQNGHEDAADDLVACPYTLFNSPYRGDSVLGMAKSDAMREKLEKAKQQRETDSAYFKEFKAQDPGIVREDIDYLIIAIIKKDLSAIRGCLLTYPNIKVVEHSKFYSITPLARAIQDLAQKNGKAYEDAFAIVQLLLKTSNININARMSTTEPLLFMVTSIGDVRVLELFLADPKLDPNLQDDVGYTALHDAVERGHMDCVVRLLNDARVDSSLENKKGETASNIKNFKPNCSGSQS